MILRREVETSAERARRHHVLRSWHVIAMWIVVSFVTLGTGLVIGMGIGSVPEAATADVTTP